MKKVFSIFLFIAVVFSLTACAITDTDFIDNSDSLNIASESVLTIEAYDKKGAVIASGCGFVLKEESVVATNFHVIEGAYSVRAVDGEGSSNKVKHVLAYDKENDIALPEFVSGKGYEPLFANTKEISKGEKVVAIGSSLDVSNTFSAGIVSGYIEVDGKRYIHFTAPVSN